MALIVSWADVDLYDPSEVLVMVCASPLWTTLESHLLTDPLLTLSLVSHEMPALTALLLTHSLVLKVLIGSLLTYSLVSRVLVGPC